MTPTRKNEMTEIVDRLKTLPPGHQFPKGGICKICGFGGPDANFRFPDVCGSHECRVIAGVCDCPACKKITKADIQKQIMTVLIDLRDIKNLRKTEPYRNIARKAEILLDRMNQQEIQEEPDYGSIEIGYNHGSVTASFLTLKTKMNSDS